jgi:hypothetical protein
LLWEERGFVVVSRRWQAAVAIAAVAAMGVVLILAQACGGGAAGEDVAPTATSPATSTAVGGFPGIGEMTPGAGPPGDMLFIGGASEELAAFLGISLEQLQSELDAEGATPASVAEAHGRTREELKTFFTEQQQAQLSDAVAAGTMSQEDADNTMASFASRIDDIIDGNVLYGGGAGGMASVTPGAGPPGAMPFIGGASEEFAAFLGIPLDQLQSELGAEGATPASVAEAHGRSREELKTFFIEQLQAQLSEAVSAGTMSQEDADNMMEGLESGIDGIIDGEMQFGGPGAPPAGQ